MSNSWKKELPMLATYSRIAFAPVLVAIIHVQEHWSGYAAAAVFIVASFTDWLDGYWARKYNAESSMGKFMDPIADKILVLSALIMLLHQGLVDPIMVFIFISRDIYIGGIRSVAAINQVIIAAKPFGKWKTATQMLAIPCLFVFEFNNLPLHKWGYWGLWVAVGLSLLSGAQYTWGYYTGRQS